MDNVVDLNAFRETPSPLEKRGGGGDSTGMDPWQQTVETRLGELRSDLRSIANDVSDIKADVGKLQVTVGGMPTKGYINAVVGAAVALIVAFLALQTFVQTNLVKLPAVAVTSK